MSNKLAQLVGKINGSNVSNRIKSWALSLAFNSQVKFAGTSGIRINELTARSSQVELRNRWRVQNHIGGIHACGMALLAESATGVVFGMNVPDTHLPLLKSMKVEFNRRAQGDLRAHATLSEEQIDKIQKTEKGSTIVSVEISDLSNQHPIVCEMEWAWTTKPKKS